MPCPSVFRLKDWAREFFSWRLESFRRIGGSSDSWGIGFPEGYFPAETFHNAYPSVGMPMGRAVCGIAERSEGKIRCFGM